MPTPSRHRYSMEELLGETPDGWNDLNPEFATVLKRPAYARLGSPPGISVRKYQAGWQGVRRMQGPPLSYITSHFDTAHAAMAAVDDRFEESP